METNDISESVSGQDIFNEAISDAPKQEQTQNTPETPTEAHTEAKGGRARDEKGRFAPAKADEPEEVVAEAAPEPEVEAPQETPEKQDHRVPLSELLNTRERAQKAEAEREALRQHLWQMQSKLAELQKPKEEPIDMFAQPEAWQQTIEQRINAMKRETEANFSLRLAKKEYGADFDAAWQEMASRTQMGDDSMRQAVIQSSDPGETLVQLYRQEKAYKEVGPDPIAWLAKKQEEWLQDPTVQAKVLEMARGTAKANPEPQVKLPPSLNKATAAASATDNEPLTGHGLYQFATGR